MGYDAQVIRSKRAEGLQIFLRSISIYDLLIPLGISQPFRLLRQQALVGCRQSDWKGNEYHTRTSSTCVESVLAADSNLFGSPIIAPSLLRTCAGGASGRR